MVFLLFACLLTSASAACGDKPFCDECLLEPLCGWCGSKGVCLSSEDGCPGPDNLWQYPDSEVTAVRTSGTSPFNPTEIDIFLRPGHVLVTTIAISPTDLLPLDLLILEDLSFSFDDDLVTLSSLVPALVSAVKTYQDDTVFGLASFIDLPSPPFAINTDYVYKQHIAMTAVDPVNTLRDGINALSVGDGGDTPEGQLSALLLAAQSSTIGWRPDSRKVIMLSTDAPYHVAGDGYMAGITKRNNGDGVDGNTGSGILGEDFPSVQQVLRVLTAENVVPIIAVTANHVNTWQGVIDTFGFGSVNVLEEDSGNIVVAIREALEALGSTIALKAGADDTFSLVKSVNPPVPYTDVLLGSSVEFEVTFLADTPSGDTTLTLISPGFGSIPVTVTMDYACDCTEADLACPIGPGGLMCDDSGVCACGKCDCDDGFIGPDCACNTTAPCPEDCFGRGFCRECECVCDAEFTGTLCECRKTCPGDCNGHGACSCGVCVCEPGWSGPDCSCDDRAVCPLGCVGGACKCGECVCDPDYVGAICDICVSGSCLTCPTCGSECSGHGSCCPDTNSTCECEKCQCLEGWTGADCDCDTTAPCRKPDSPANVTDDCGEFGTCECGTCRCNLTHSGDFCEECITLECLRCASGCGRNCSGNGDCNCTTCECHEGFSGDYCECEDDKVCEGGCGGNGVCVCGACECFDGFVTVDGPCDTCFSGCAIPPSCDYGSCDKCKADGNCNWCEDKKICLPASAQICTFAGECPLTALGFVTSPAGVAVLVLGVLLLIFIGLAVLFSIIQKIREKREWAKYNESLKQSKWDNSQNAIYKKGEKEQANALYQGK